MGRAWSLNDDEGSETCSPEQGHIATGQGLWRAGGMGGEGRRRGSGRERGKRGALLVRARAPAAEPTNDFRQSLTFHF